MVKHVVIILSQVTGHVLELRQQRVQASVPSYCCSLMRGCITFSPTGLTVTLDISSGGDAA